MPPTSLSSPRVPTIARRRSAASRRFRPSSVLLAQRMMQLLALALCIAAFATDLHAQSRADIVWNDARTLGVVQRATERRAVQLADTGLVDYRATARGYLTFLAQLGDESGRDFDPPRVVKSDQLALELYWRAPDLSKQRIVGRRDTLLLPTDINYHRDHLGIIQNNFPNVIRLGDGDEVLDVPHPLSASGIGEYDFVITDSLALRLPDRSIEMLEVRVRPKDDRQPRAVGALFIDKAEGQVVRMAFSFTRAALRDKQLEDVSVVLENALVNARFWLPRRQEIEIRRTGSWLDYPARGIIRGRWEICCYEVNKGFDVGQFAGPEIVQAPLAEQARFPWTGSVLDSLPPDVVATTDEEVKQVQADARELVRGGALARVRSTALSARAISDFVRVNRAEGLALGAGVRRRLGGGFSTALRARYGLDDEEAKGSAALVWERANATGAELRFYRDYRDASDERETSGVRNSIAAQEFGSDYTEPFDVRGVALGLDLGARLGTRLRLDGALERHDAVAIAASPVRGRYERTIPALKADVMQLALRGTRAIGAQPGGASLRGEAELRGIAFDPRDVDDGDDFIVGRLWTAVQGERPLGGRRRVLARLTVAGVAGPRVPPQSLAYAGGPTTAPGYRYHELAGRLVSTGRIEWRTPGPFVSLPLGRFGAAPGTMTLAPFAHTAYVARAAEFQLSRAGWYPSVGVGALFLFELLRVDVARGLRDGRWSVSADVTREFWGIL